MIYDLDVPFFLNSFVSNFFACLFNDACHRTRSCRVDERGDLHLQVVPSPILSPHLTGLLLLSDDTIRNINESFLVLLYKASLTCPWYGYILLRHLATSFTKSGSENLQISLAPTIEVGLNLFSTFGSCVIVFDLFIVRYFPIFQV